MQSSFFHRDRSCPGVRDGEDGDDEDEDEEEDEEDKKGDEDKRVRMMMTTMMTMMMTTMVVMMSMHAQSGRLRSLWQPVEVHKVSILLRKCCSQVACLCLTGRSKPPDSIIVEAERIPYVQPREDPSNGALCYRGCLGATRGATWRYLSRP